MASRDTAIASTGIWWCIDCHGVLAESDSVLHELYGCMHAVHLTAIKANLQILYSLPQANLSLPENKREKNKGEEGLLSRDKFH